VRQTYREIEIIIVDDGSTDDTFSVASKLARKHRIISVVRQQNGGPGLAREAGRQKAQGEFIQYLDSDDLLLPEKFSWQVKELQKNQNCGVAYGKTRFCHANGQVEPGAWKRSGEKIEIMFPSFLQSRWWDTPTPLYRASVCNAAGGWSSLRLEEDWEYDCRIAAGGVRLVYIPEFVCEVRDHSEPRLCRGDTENPERMKQRVSSHELIFKHAQKAGIQSDAPEMKHFSRELFLLCRQSGALGLTEEAALLFDLARKASGEERGRKLSFTGYHLMAQIIGWKNAGRLTCLADRFRS
jgi:hypothetical protein